MLGVNMKIQRPYPRQIEFLKSTSKYTAYGGSRGGGKSHAVRVKACLLGATKAGINMLIARRVFSDLRNNHIVPLMRMLKGVAKYNEQKKEFVFVNGSRLAFGHCETESDTQRFLGQAFDVIFLEEATQFSEFQFQIFTECLRPYGQMEEPFKVRMYLTCNPGGIGHNWVKRLFIDKQYKPTEDAEDYNFIKSTVYDNEYLMKNAPDYVKALENLPEDRKRAMLYGDWDVFSGQYFTEFNRDIHCVEPFDIPKDWRIYCSIDYGFDMAAFLIIAVDFRGNAYVINEFCQGKDNGMDPLIITDAAKKLKEMTKLEVYRYFAPPDLFNKRQETGRSVADIFYADGGIMLEKASNGRVDGWLSVKEWLKPVDDIDGTKTAKLRIFNNCTNLIKNIPQLQYDNRNSTDVSTTPHDITHLPDALRYFCASYIRAAEKPVEEIFYDEFSVRPKSFYGEGERINVI